MPQEKVYLHFDKPFYATGDTIWLKAYLVNAERNELSLLSNIIYADLLDSRDSVVASIRLPASVGLTRGYFKTDPGLHPGVYRIRAYTRWMRNFDPAFYFNQQIDMLSSTLPRGVTARGQAESAIISTGSNYHRTIAAGAVVRFFPEGGSLVNGIESVVAVKALSPDGRGADFTGNILGKNGDKLMATGSSYLGMASFRLSPETGLIYKAALTFSDGSEKIVEIPAALSQGYMLDVNNQSSDFLRIRVAGKGMAGPGKITVLAAMNGVPYYISQSNAGDSVAYARVSKIRFPTGILNITLFSPDDKPMAERLVFINHLPGLTIRLSPGKTQYRPRELVKLDLSVSDSISGSLTGSFSLAVTNNSLTGADETEEQTILTSLLLSSDLKGYIEKPAYYFMHQDRVASSRLDLLMLTQGWSRYNWQDLLDNKLLPQSFLAEKGIDITGHVRYENGKPVPGGKISLISMGMNTVSTDTVIDADGRFIFAGLILPDSTRLILQARDLKKKRNLRIVPDKLSAPADHFQGPRLPATEITTATPGNAGINPYKKAYLDNKRNQLNDQFLHGNRPGIQLKEVVVKATKESRTAEVLKNSSNLNGAGNADRVLTYLDLAGCPNLTTCLQGTVAGVTILNGKAFSSRAPGRPMLIILDGVAMLNMTLDDIDVYSIGSIEIMKSITYLAVYGPQAANGALLITTKRGNTDYSVPGYVPAADPARGFVFFSPKGYELSREFYSPAYPAPASGSSLPEVRQAAHDLRSTIYWNPDIVTDKDGKASVQFYTGDGTGTYRAVLQGMTPRGKLGRQVITFTVK